MKKTVNNSYEFIDEFVEYDREGCFTKEGLHALYDYLEEKEVLENEEYDLDVIEICTKYTEYTSVEEIKKDYPIDELNLNLRYTKTQKIDESEHNKDELQDVFSCDVIVVHYVDGGIGYILHE